MRVSEFYQLGRTQPTLDFVDVDVDGDVLVFIDPRALRLLPSTWGDECVSLLQVFFRHVLDLIRAGHSGDAQANLRVLREPNETHLGFSRGRSRGRALGPDLALDVYDALNTSEAARSGLLEDLEDTILMVPRIGPDIVSDITTNVIRAPLIRYTQDACRTYGIPLDPEVSSGLLWDPGTHTWYSEFVQLPRAHELRLFLVPKAIVRVRMDYNEQEYYSHYLLEELREAELNANTELVHLLRDGTPRVTKKDLTAKYGQGKQVIARQTLAHPDALRRYREDKSARVAPPLTHDEIADVMGSDPPDWDALRQQVLAIPPGREAADRYEKAIEPLLTALFYPWLTNPQVQFPIHQGRKRIDITYTNVSQVGFFRWLSMHYPCAHLFIECKNYSGEVGNPELDQLSGRFSPSRGQVGLLICRSFDNKPLFLQRCRDTAIDQRGYILPLDDSDLTILVQYRIQNPDQADLPLMHNVFEQLVM